MHQEKAGYLLNLLPFHQDSDQGIKQEKQSEESGDSSDIITVKGIKAHLVICIKSVLNYSPLPPSYFLQNFTFLIYKGRDSCVS